MYMHIYICTYMYVCVCEASRKKCEYPCSSCIYQMGFSMINHPAIGRSPMVLESPYQLGFPKWMTYGKCPMTGGAHDLGNLHMYVYIRMYGYSDIYIYICLCLSIYLFIYLSICLFVYLFIY